MADNARCICGHRKADHTLRSEICDHCMCSQFRLDLSVTQAESERLDKEISTPEKKTSLRSSLLNEAEELVTGDRNNQYGEPHQDFARTAGALTALGYRGPNGRDMQAHDVAIMVSVVKMSRLMWTPTKRDSWVDIAGYAACGYEAAELTLNSEKEVVNGS